MTEPAAGAATPIEYEQLARSNAGFIDEMQAAAARVIRGGWYVLGEEVRAFEQEFAAWVGAGHCVGVANGTDAIIIGLKAAGIGAGDEVILPSHTYIATAEQGHQ